MNTDFKLHDKILKSHLHTIEIVNYDDTLDIQLRDKEPVIYYRGRKIATLLLAGKHKIINGAEASGKIDFGNLKQYVDLSAENKKKSKEKEYQQLMTYENNTLSSTDFFIIDYEFSIKSNRIDLIGIRWDSEASKRKLHKGYMPRLALMEIKYTDKAVDKRSGIRDHIDKLERDLNDVDINTLKTRVKNLVAIKMKYNLLPQIPCENISLSKEKPYYIIIIADHDPESKRIINELPAESKYKNFELKFAAANFFGYGIYKENLYSLNKFKQRFSKQISL